MMKVLPAAMELPKMHGNPKILIVDDREANLVALRKVLEHLDAEVFSALSGNEALALTIEHEFALAILDVQMPAMDGFELAGLLRGEANTCDIPIIFVSAVFTEDAHVFRGYESGAVDFLPKPIQPEWLLGKARVFLDLYREKMTYKNRLKVSDTVQEVLIYISRHLNVTGTPNVKSSVAKCLELLCRCTMADRIYLSICSSSFDRSYREEWCLESVEPRRSELRYLSPSDMPWIAGQLRLNKLVFIPSISDLPPEAMAERSIFSADGIQSCVIVPIVETNCPDGFLALDWIEQPTPLMEFIVALIQVAGSILFGALNRLWSESALRESESRQELALQGADLGTWDWDASTDRVIYSQRWAEIVGYSQVELEPVLGTWVSRIHPDDLADTLKALQSHMDGREDFYESEHRLLNKAGEWVWVLDRGKVMERDSLGLPLRACGTHMDITRHKQLEHERTQAEIQLHQAQKMESIGQLAGGVAHDFNNLLSVIMGNAELITMGGDLSPAQRENIDVVINASHRASRLTKQLLLFSRKQAISPHPLDCNEKINSSVKLYRRLIGEDIELCFDAAPEFPMIFADDQQLDQVIANLLINARDAIHDRENNTALRTITIKSSVVEEVPGMSKGPDSQPPYYVRIDVCDTGIGMTSEIQSQIFEPFFTTKPAGRGTGLGLSTVFGIVKHNKGLIEVKSVLGEGTEFRTYWPGLAVSAAPMFVESQTEPRIKSREGQELILFVEDDSDLRDISVQFLRRKGYQVIESGSGDEAVELLANNSYCPDLLITDVVMPGISGLELASAATRNRRDLRVLLISGYTEDILSRFLSKGHGFEMLEKPYGVEVLLNRVESMLADMRHQRELHCASAAG